MESDKREGTLVKCVALTLLLGVTSLIASCSFLSPANPTYDDYINNEISAVATKMNFPGLSLVPNPTSKTAPIQYVGLSACKPKGMAADLSGCPPQDAIAWFDSPLRSSPEGGITDQKFCEYAISALKMAPITKESLVINGETQEGCESKIREMPRAQGLSHTDPRLDGGVLVGYAEDAMQPNTFWVSYVKSGPANSVVSEKYVDRLGLIVVKVNPKQASIEDYLEKQVSSQ